VAVSTLKIEMLLVSKLAANANCALVAWGDSGMEPSMELPHATRTAKENSVAAGPVRGLSSLAVSLGGESMLAAIGSCGLFPSPVKDEEIPYSLVRNT